MRTSRFNICSGSCGVQVKVLDEIMLQVKKKKCLHMLPTCVFKVDWLVSPPVKKRRLSLQLGDANRRTRTVIDSAPVSSVQKRKDTTQDVVMMPVNIYVYIYFYLSPSFKN